MKYLLRRGINAAAVTSALLCMATVFLWVRSYRDTDTLSYDYPTSPAGGPGELSFSSSIGTLTGRRLVSGTRCGLPVRSGLRFDSKPVDPTKSPRQPVLGPAVHSFIAFAYSKSFFMPQPVSFMGPASKLSSFVCIAREVQAPDWSFVAVTGFFSGFRLLWPGARRRRLARNLCLTCGYDLRATLERCSECGAVPSSSLRG